MSRIVPKFYGKVVNGKIVRARQKLYDVLLKGLEGKDVEEVLQKEQKDQTKPQRGYFFAVVCGIVTEHHPGNTKTEIYEWLQKKIWERHPQTFIGPDGIEMPKAYKISKMTRAQLSWFIDECSILIYEEWQIVVPEAGQIYLEE